MRGMKQIPILQLFKSCFRIATPSGRKIEFKVDGIRRDALLSGLNEVELTLTREKEIAAHQAKARAATPWLYATSLSS